MRMATELHRNGTKHVPGRQRSIMAALSLAVAVLLPIQAPAAPKQKAEPIATPIRMAHCLRMYDIVELRLKGKGDDVVSLSTRNGLKDFFVTRPGKVDCTGQRELPWRDDKDRAFLESLLKETNDSSKPKVDMTQAYAVAPAARSSAR